MQERLRSLDHLSIRVMLDSGAFGAWKRGTTLDLGQYIDFIKSNHDLLVCYVNMDTIPANPDGASRTVALLNHAATESRKAFLRMTKAGLDPISVFHQGEQIIWLERMIDESDYIGLSFFRRSHRNEIRAWLDSCFELITRRRGWVKTHGFGLTASNLILRYPWHSVDSVTWARNAGYARVWVPRYVGGKPDYSVPSVQITISDRPQITRHDRPIDNMGPLSRQSIELFVKDANTTVDALRKSAAERSRLYLHYFKRLLEYKNSQSDHPCRIYFVSSPSAARTLCSAGCYDHLLTYFDMVNKQNDILKDYVSSGVVQ